MFGMVKFRVRIYVIQYTKEGEYYENKKQQEKFSCYFVNHITL